MNRRAMVLGGIGVMFFTTMAVGASTLVLEGSDGAPGTGKTEMSCATNLAVKNPIHLVAHDNMQISHVDISGEMAACEGQYMVVEVDLPDGPDADIIEDHAYAIHQFAANDHNLVFHFHAVSGDFYDTYPALVDGHPVPTGTKLSPIAVKDFGLVTVTIAATWE